MDATNDMKLACLELAIKTQNMNGPYTVVAQAQKYYDFVTKVDASPVTQPA